MKGAILTISAQIRPYSITNSFSKGFLGSGLGGISRLHLRLFRLLGFLGTKMQGYCGGERLQKLGEILPGNLARFLKEKRAVDRRRKTAVLILPFRHFSCVDVIIEVVLQGFPNDGIILFRVLNRAWTIGPNPRFYNPFNLINR